MLLGLQLALPQLRALSLGGLAIVAITVAVTFAGTRLFHPPYGRTFDRLLGLLKKIA